MILNRRTSKTCLVLCPRLNLSMLLLLRKTPTYQHTRHQLSYLCKPPFACFHIPHSNDLSAPPPGRLPSNDRGSICCVAGALFAFLFGQRGGVYSRFCSFSPKIAPRGVKYDRSVYSQYYKHEVLAKLLMRIGGTNCSRFKMVGWLHPAWKTRMQVGRVQILRTLPDNVSCHRPPPPVHGFATLSRYRLSQRESACLGSSRQSAPPKRRPASLRRKTCRYAHAVCF